MAGKRDYYDVLGISSSASSDEIKAAHRKLARKFHPDVNKEDDASEKFAEVQEAYDILSDEEKKTKYDRYGHSGFGNSQSAGSGASGWSNVDSETFEDIFGAAFGGRRRGPSGFGGFDGDFGGPGPRGPVKGRDIEHVLDIGFAIAAFGGSETLKMGTPDGGSTTIDVKIPAGSEDGSTLRIRGKGEPGSGSGPNGDLLLKLKVGAHPWFTRKGLDLSITVPISITEATLGAKVRVPLLKGSATMTIPPAIRSGGKLRIKGKGITDSRERSGDLHVIVEIVAPQELEDEDRAALESMSSRLPNPRAELPWSADVED